ncbi:exonuclease SbcC [Desertihabitans brevis]|uniref:Exonuclease SbcC n=1 Tax=Desertihabitans brevis TaxID=2268447 RepID=A0A367YSH9_9ACTN|nr:exonuclease SbcC [Desertihabitans brevis]
MTVEELRVVVRFAAAAAEELLPVFERRHPDDGRPRAALEAARVFVEGAPRTRLQRVASVEAHRAAREAATEVARLAAQAAGDAAAAAYLHPLARATQVGHILRAAADAARVAEIEAGEDAAAADRAVERWRERAPAVLVDVLRRYPPAPAGRNRVARLVSTLDSVLREAPGG